MAETVRLTIQTGPHKGRRFCFCGTTSCLVGRAADCFMRFVGDDRDLRISRHHCQLFVDPPAVRVQDLGSLNGTYINGHTVQTPKEGEDAPTGNVQNGDIITIGGTSFVVDLVDCAGFANADRDPIWKEGEVAKEDCPIPCPVDGSVPFVARSVGGFGTQRRS